MLLFLKETTLSLSDFLILSCIMSRAFLHCCLLTDHYGPSSHYSVSRLRQQPFWWYLYHLSLPRACWRWSCNALATWCKELTQWKRPWCWVKLRTGREGYNRGRDGWMASPTQWTWVWASSGKWWGQGDLACCSPWGCKELDMTEQLNGTDKVPASSVKWYSVGGRGLSVVVYKYYKLQNNY